MKNLLGVITNLLVMTCVLTGLPARGGGGGGSVVAPMPGNFAVVGTATVSPEVLVTLGDSITAGANGSAYPPMLAATLGASLMNLGIGGEFSGPLNFQIPGGALLNYGGVLADQVPNIPLNATIVTLYIGTNDLIFSGMAGFPTYLDPVGLIAEYQTNVRAIIAGVRARVPNARIFIASVPNGANRPNGLTWAASLRTTWTTMTAGMRNVLVGTGLPLVDLMNEPAMYDDANFGGPTDPHPVASGFSVIAADFAKVIQSR